MSFVSYHGVELSPGQYVEARYLITGVRHLGHEHESRKDSYPTTEIKVPAGIIKCRIVFLLKLFDGVYRSSS